MTRRRARIGIIAAIANSVAVSLLLVWIATRSRMKILSRHLLRHCNDNGDADTRRSGNCTAANPAGYRADGACHADGPVGRRSGQTSERNPFAAPYLLGPLCGCLLCCIAVCAKDARSGISAATESRIACPVHDIPDGGHGPVFFLAIARIPLATAASACFVSPIIAVLSAVSHVLSSTALRYGDASTLAPLNYPELVAASLLGYFFFGELPGLSVRIGAGVIVAVGLVLMQRPAAQGR